MNTSTPAAVVLRDVVVRAGERVLLQVPALSIGPGERVAVVGPNGAGKSTLLKLMGGLLQPATGTVQALGRPLAGPRRGADRRALQRETGLLLQGLHLVPRLTAQENVLVGALGRLQGLAAWRSLLRWYPPRLVHEADDALAALGLADRGPTRADRLSGGERQKVALARLQLQQPRLVLADEPTSALDPAATAQVCEALRAVAAGPDRTLVTVVHDLSLLPLLASRVIALGGGRVLWDLPLAEAGAERLQALYAAPVAGSAPASPRVAAAPTPRSSTLAPAWTPET